MPELPEVERGRRLAESVARRRTIARLWCAADPIVFDGVGPARMRRALLGARVEAVRRRGKHLWFELDRAPHPLFHFGMSGAFRVPAERTIQLASSPRKRSDDEWPPRFRKIHIWFDDGGELVMTNSRRLGRIRLRDDPPREPPLSRLGFDPLLDLPSRRAFAELLARRSGILKALLLDQSFAAGVGNWIADDVLYLAKLDPRRTADSLTGAEAERLRRALRTVIDTAVGANAERRRFPRGWLFHRRWGKEKRTRTLGGRRIEFIEIGGRTTAWVPSAQR